MTRRHPWLWLVALVVVLSACSVDATVTVTVHEDGSGVVRLDAVVDAEAVQSAEVAGGKLEDRVRLGDLSAAGWTVQPWVRNLDGSAQLTVSKPFSSVDQVAGIVKELNGAHGPLPRLGVTRTRSFFATHFGATGRIDLGTVSTGITSDADLAAKLAAQGVDVAGVDHQLLTQLQHAVDVKLVVELPGHAPITVHPAGGAAAPVDASGTVVDGTRVALVAAAAGLVVLALLVAVWPRRRGRRRRRRRVRTEVSRGPGTSPTRRRSPPAS